VIRDEDLGILSATVSAASTGISAGVLSSLATAPAGPLAAAGGVVVGLLMLVSNASRKGTVLDPIKIQILLCLKTCTDGCTEERLAEKMNAIAPTYPPWTPDRVRPHLEMLERTRVRDGNVVALTEKAGDGRWSACGV
jgi:hypothetical protein